MKIELISLEVQKVIVQSFIEDFQNGKQIDYIFDKINYLDILTASVLTEVSIVLEYIQIPYNPLSNPIKLRKFWPLVFIKFFSQK